MRRFNQYAVAGLILAVGRFTHAAELATATLSQAGTSGSNFVYNVTLTDTGTTNIGTFWYAWVPGKDFLAISPVSETTPTGWTDSITNGGTSDGFAIQWVANSNLLTPGNSLSFSFTTADNFASVSGNSIFFPSTPVGTSFVYGGGPFSDGGDRFVVATPEPALIALIGVPACVMMRRRRSR